MAELESTVWMFHSEVGPEGVKGRLKLTTDGLVFSPVQGSGGAGRAFSFDRIARVKRLRASPVLELRLRPSGGPRLVGFYFVQPPSLEAQQDSGLLRRRRVRRDAAVSLVRLNAVKKDEIATWVEAIETGMERG